MSSALVPAATLLLLRAEPYSVLMAKRHAGLVFGANHWVFPGGRIDAVDRAAAAAWTTTDEGAARHACLREAREETGIDLDPARFLSALVPFARWIAPAPTPRRFDTWFFIGEATAEAVPVADGGEVVEALFVEPARMLERLARAEIDLMPPTALTLEWLAKAGSAPAALARARARIAPLVEPEVFMREGVPWIRLRPESGYDRLECPSSVLKRPPAGN